MQITHKKIYIQIQTHLEQLFSKVYHKKNVNELTELYYKYWLELKIDIST